MTTNVNRLLPVIAVLALAAGAAQAGKLYKWVDEHGVTHYSERMPAKYKDNKSTEIDKHGRVLKHNDAGMTAEEIRATEQARADRKAQEKQLEEQRRRDNALLNTYTTASEIDDARDRALGGATQARQAIDVRLKAAVAKGEGYQKQKQNFESRGKPVPESLTEDIDQVGAEIAKIRKELKTKEDEIVALRKKYEADKARFVELTTSSASK